MAATRLGSEVEGLGHGPTIAVNPNNKVHALYTGADGKIHYTRWNGSQWTADQTLPSPSPRNFFQRAVASPQGPPHVVFTGGGNSSSYAIYYTTRQGPTWTPPIQVSAEPGAQVPAIAIAPDGALHVVYYLVSTGKIYYTHNDGSGWSQSQSVANGIHPEIAVDGGGTLHMVWMAATPPYGVMYARRTTDGTWSTPLIIGKAHGQQIPALALDGAGNVSVVWYCGGGANTLTFAQIAPDGTLTRTRNIQGAFTFSHHPRIAIDSFNRVYIVYQAKSAASQPWSVFQRVFDGTNWTDPARLDTPPQADACQVPDISASGSTLAVIWWNSARQECYADVITLATPGTLSLSAEPPPPARRKSAPRKPAPRKAAPRKPAARSSTKSKRAPAKTPRRRTSTKKKNG